MTVDLNKWMGLLACYGRAGRGAQEALQRSAHRGLPAGCPSDGSKSGVKGRDADVSAPAD